MDLDQVAEHLIASIEQHGVVTGIGDDACTPGMFPGLAGVTDQLLRVRTPTQTCLPGRSPGLTRRRGRDERPRRSGGSCSPALTRRVATTGCWISDVGCLPSGLCSRLD